MKTRLFVLVTLFMMLFSASAFADVSGGSITKLRNTSDGQKIVIFTQEGYSVAIQIEYTHLTEEAANRWLSNDGRFGAVQRGSITKMRSTSDGTKVAIYTQEGYSVGTVLEYVAAKPMEASNVIEAVNGFLTEVGKVRILDEHTHSADNYIQIEAVYLSEEAANRWLAKGGSF